MYTNKPIHFYSSTQGLVCVVPAPRITGVKTDSAGNPIAVYYPSYPQGYCNPTGREFKDLKGLNVEDYQEYKPELVIYELGDGSFLAATKEAIAKAGTGTNNACSKETACYLHLVKDLKVLDQQPEFDLNPPLGTPVFSF